ncbi:MAG: heme-binding protein [Betaproteobacteria bacterium]|nr:MAG: heme-binding protein [Betaproteobacteria bacterium]
MTAIRVLALLASVILAPCARAEDGTVAFRNLAPETALTAAQAAIKKCRDSGWQVAVAVVDRSGVIQVMLRDRFAGPHTPRTASGKAWTAVSFRTATSELARLTQPGQPQSGVRHLPRVVALGGGLTIEAQGSIVGGIGVSGAPAGEADDTCARAGIDAIRDRIAF